MIHEHENACAVADAICERCGPIPPSSWWLDGVGVLGHAARDMMNGFDRAEAVSLGLLYIILQGLIKAKGEKVDLSQTLRGAEPTITHVHSYPLLVQAWGGLMTPGADLADAAKEVKRLLEIRAFILGFSLSTCVALGVVEALGLDKHNEEGWDD